MGKTLSETAQAIYDKKKVLNETAASETLKPKSMPAEPTKTLGRPATSTDQPKKVGEGENAGAKASSVVSKDKSAPTKTAKTDAQVVNQEQDAIDKGREQLEEDIELDEEVTAFIDGLVAEGPPEEEIIKSLEENFELVEEDTIEEEAIEEEVATEDYTIDMSEHVNALFEGEKLSEDFKVKAATIFEAAVKQVVEAELVKFEQAYAETLEEEVNTITEELATKADDYLNYVVEQWVSENEVAIETGLRAELTEDFINSMKQVFMEHYIDIPEDKINVVEELASKVPDLENKLNEEIENGVTLTKLLNESKKDEVINTLTEGLKTTQEKLKTLSEGIEYSDIETFGNKVKTLRENYFPSKTVTGADSLDNIEPGTEGKTMIMEETTGAMSKYVKALGRQVK